jgi:hypothetical protein
MNTEIALEEIRAMKVRPCGECTMCCKLLGISKHDDGGLADFPFDKPAGTTCNHCDPGHGCRIFGTEQFPNLCKSYFCLWKIPEEGFPIPEDHRPDKIHAIFGQVEPLPEFPKNLIVRVTIDPHRNISEQFINWLDEGAKVMNMCFLLDDGGIGMAITHVPGLGAALEARERAKCR